MRKHIFLFTIFVSTVLLSTSCKKYLNESPINAPYSGNFWTSESNVQQAAQSMYSQLRDALRDGRSHFIFGDLTTGLFHCSNICDWSLNAVSASYSPAFFFSYVPYNEEALQDWSRFYKIIAQSNLIMQNVPMMNPGLFQTGSRESYVAEALFMRAYTYFYMIRIWGDPVYVNKTYDDVDYGKIPALPRTGETIVLDSCINDLKTAAQWLGYGGSQIRANKATVYSLLGHIYAWRHEYDSAHKYLNAVITGGGYSLEPMATYGNIWKGQASNESIFEIPMMKNDNAGITETDADLTYGSFDGFFSIFLKGSLADNQKNNAWILAKGGVSDMIFTDQTNDQRFLNYLQYTAANNGDDAGWLLLKYSDFQYQTASTKSNPYVNNNLVLFRLADIILLDAEALASLGQLEPARSLLKQTETRAGITSYQNPTNEYDMLDEIVAERGRELMGEGIWYYDLIRTEPAQTWLDAIGYPSNRLTAANKGYYWPLNMGTLFAQDNLLTQNPWWAANK